MNKKIDIKESIIVAGTYISICIGSGFATGQEIMQFFSSHGMISVLASLICMVLMAYCGASLLTMGQKAKLKNSNDIYTYLCGKYIGNFFKIFMPIFFFCSFVVMISGAGASINQYYGVDKTIGCSVVGILVLASVILGMDKIKNILGNIGPIIVILSISIGIITILRNVDNLGNITETINKLNLDKAIDSWWMTGIIYTGLNLIIAVTFLTSLGKTIKTKSSCIIGGVIGAIVFILCAIILNIAIMSDISQLYNQEIPTLQMAKSIGPIVGGMFSIVLIAGIYTTAVPLLWSVGSTFGKEGSKTFIASIIISTILGIILSRVSFSTLVRIIYPISGVVGVIIIIFIIISSIKKGIYRLVK